MLRTHPDCGKELQRTFEVHENGYDCADFYDGCKGWRALRDFECRLYNRLPDVMPGMCGQAFPPSRRSELAKCQSADKDIAAGGDAQAEVAGLPHETHKAKVRACRCGAVMPKGKRLCDGCRTKNRRQTKCDYMRVYMEQRRSAAVGPDSGMPFPAAATQSVQAGGDDLVLTGLRPGSPLPNRLLY
jgi:hypothetical protein